MHAELLIVLIGLISFHNIFGNSFHFDDGHSIVDNENLRKLSHIPEFFIDPGNFSALSDVEMYRPLLLCTYALNYAVDGYNPIGYHLVNLVLHLSNALLVLRLARYLRIPKQTQLLAGMFFVCHPLMTEPLNYVSSRSSILVTLFGLIFLNAMVQKRIGTMLIGNMLALFCKATGIILPFIAMAWYRGGGQYVNCRRWWILSVPGIAYLLVSSSVVKSAIAQPVRNYWIQIYTQIKAFVFYLKKTVFPYSLSIEPGFSISNYPNEWVVVCASAVLISLFWIISFCRPPKYFRQITQLTGWYFLLLIPVSFVPLNILVNEHRLYMPMVSFALVSAMLFGQRRIRPYSGWILCVVMIALCIDRNKDWRSEVSIWLDAVQKSPDMPRPLVNLGKSLLEAGEIEQSIAVSLRAINKSPTSSTAHFNLGTAYLHQEDFNKAKNHLEKSVILSESLSPADNNLAAVYRHLNDPERAIIIYRRLLIGDPRLEFQHNIAKAHLKAGNPDSAIFYFKGTIQTDSNHKEGYFGLFKGLCLQNKIEEAFELFELIASKWPNDYELLNRFLITLDQMDWGHRAIEVVAVSGYDRMSLYRVIGGAALSDKRWDVAYDYFELALNSGGKRDPVLLNYSGVALLGMRESVAALRQFRKAVQIDKEFAEAYANIGRVLLRHRKFNDALAATQHALRIEPMSSDYWALKGRIFERLDKPKRAANCYEKATNIDSTNVNYRSALARLNEIPK
ncbi:MAG: tetratricopeptide repeat protein [Candidatus Latescibacterota bacterium]|nr:tetratricopeptide repeat protein [Candidatus Latescibacterota bacterium]